MCGAAVQDGCDGAECRSLQYGVEGCSGPGTTPAPTPSPACDQPSLTNELCGQYCYEWLNELNDEIWAGTNNGECYCDTEYDPGGDANGQCTVACPESDSGCDQPCAGEPSEMCGGAWFNQIVKVSCGGAVNAVAPSPPPPATSFPADCDVAVHLGSDCSDHALVTTKCQTIAGL